MARLEALALTKRFGRRLVVANLTLAFDSGKVTGLLGPNGAGKTTTFYLLVGFLRADSGEVLLDGRKIHHLPFFRRAKLGLQYLPQEPSVFSHTNVEGNIRLALEGAGRRWDVEVDTVLDELGLRELLRRPALALSAGERRRVEIARALVTEPVFLLLDEPFTGIDPLTIAELQKLLGELAHRGIGVVITDHNVRDALRITSYAYLIHEGRIIAQGTPEALLNDPLARRYYLGTDFSL
ncbi:LPS export ABC transporter ATP-binding protein [Candidatus Bipolaricaulota sp. J31]